MYAANGESVEVNKFPGGKVAQATKLEGINGCAIK
jgi:hypothetical protein